MPTTHLHGNERIRVKMTHFKKDIFIDIYNEENEALTAMFHRMHVFQIRKKEYGTQVFVFDNEQQMQDFDFKDFSDAEILYTHIPR
jgi:hypothetical protein